VDVSVLVVDDDAEFRDLAARILRAGGLRVVGEAATCAGALEAAARLRPDAVLLDVRLPDGNGIRVGQRLAVLPWQPRVVLISSDPAAGAEVALASCPGLPFVAKADLPDGRVVQLLSGAAP
jgi:CheY-like chemotaxis protein